jgi:hypothetical protein
MRLVIVAVLALSTAAHAEPAYGTEIVAADTVSIATLVFSGGKLAPLGALGYLVAAPVLHLSHHHGGRAVASVAMRAVVPIAAIALGARATDSDDDEGWIIGALAGFVVGVAITTADDERPHAIAPVLLPVRDGGLTVGISGRF